MRKIGNPKWYRNEDGAIDLASIMVGIIVIGLIGGVIAATVFAVIPWTQDNAAKQQLGSVMQAENAYMGLSSTVPSSLPAGLAANSFGNSADLETAGLLKQGTNYCASTANTGAKGYEGYARSDSGQIFIVSDKNTSPSSFTGTLPTNCAFLGAASTPTPTPTPTPFVPSVVLSENFNGSLNTGAVKWYQSNDGTNYGLAGTSLYTNDDAGSHSGVMAGYTSTNYAPHFIKITNLNLNPGTYSMTFDHRVAVNITRKWTANIEGVNSTSSTSPYAGWVTSTLTFTITKQSSTIILRDDYSDLTSDAYYFDNFILKQTAP